MGHDDAGAQLGRVILSRLRASERLADTSRRSRAITCGSGSSCTRCRWTGARSTATWTRCAPVAVEVTVLSVADRLATRGDNAERAIAGHLTLARQLIAAGLAWRADPPRPPVRGDALARALDLAPGPRIGALLHELEEAGYAGEVSGSEEAIAYARAAGARR